MYRILVFSGFERCVVLKAPRVLTHREKFKSSEEFHYTLSGLYSLYVPVNGWPFHSTEADKRNGNSE